MGELEDTADHLIVIGRGRLLADVSVSDLIASVSGERVEIRTPEAHAAMRLLAGVGATAVSSGRDRVAVEGLPAHRVAELLASRQIRLDELRTTRATLEEAYFQLTRDAATHRAARVAAERSVA
jgi:ABC-2 type transport system ATP-binding protein